MCAFCGMPRPEGQKPVGKLWCGLRGGCSEGNAVSRRVCTSVGSGEGYQWISEAEKSLEGTGKKLIKEGVDEADYACYALRRYGIRPKEWAEMTIPERMFCCAAIELEREQADR